MANLSNINGKFVVEQTTGFVGIGTTDPAYLLHVNSSDVTNGTRIIIENTNGSGKKYGLLSDNTGVFTVRDITAGSDRFSISTLGNATFAGNVTVNGTYLTVGNEGFIRSDDSGYLHLQGGTTGTTFFNNVNNTALFTILNNGNTTFAGNVRVNGWIKGASDTNTLYSSTSLGTYLQSPTNSGTGGSIYFRNNSGTVFQTFSQVNGSATFAGNVTTTAGRLQLGAVALPSAGVAAITNRSSDNSLYIQTSSGNTAYLLDGSQNTMYSAASTAHNFYISNVPKLTIDSSGRVGIGINPFAWDSSFNNIQIGNKISLFNASTSGGLSFNQYYNGTNNIYQTNGTANRVQMDADGFHFYQAASGTAGNTATFTESLRITSGGDIQIPTNSAKIQLRSSGSSDYSSIFRDSGNVIQIANTAGTNIVSIDNGGDSTFAGNVIIGDTTATSPNSADRFLKIGKSNLQDCSIILQDAVETWEIYQNDNLRFSFGTTPTTVMTMQRTTGNVGIGTTSPSQQLELGGIASPALKLTSTSTNGGVIIFNVAGADKGFFGSGYHLGTGSSNDTAMRGESDLVFLSGGNNQRMRIDSSGNVGINSGAYLGFNGAADSSHSIGYDSVIDGVQVRGQNGIRFGTGSGTGTERLRITSVGELLKGIQTAAGQGTLAAFNSSEIGGGYINLCRDDTATIKQIRFGKNGSEVGSISTTGSATAFNTSSDYRLKENVVSMTGALDRVSELKPSRFNFIADADKTVDGFLAHEVQEIVPEAISGEKDAMQDEEYEVSPAVYEDVLHPAIEEELDEDGNIITEAKEEWTENVLKTEAVKDTRQVPKYQGIDQSKLVPLLVGAIQELKAEIEILKNK